MISLGILDKPVLNIAGSKGHFFLFKDKHPNVPVALTPLVPKDLILGNVVTIFGRKIRLCDCNDFTRSYYEELSISEFTELLPPASLCIVRVDFMKFLSDCSLQ